MTMRPEEEPDDRLDPDALNEVCHGSPDATDTRRLIELVYPQLKRIARIHMSRERLDHTWQPTALVSEVFLKLAREPGIQWRDRSHFLVAASKAMRLLLIDHARSHRSQKHGGGLCAFQLDDLELPHINPTIEYVEIHRLLNKMAAVDKRMADVVELKIFGGLTFAEVGEILGVHERTVKRDWQVARAWLFGELRGEEADVGRGMGEN